MASSPRDPTRLRQGLNPLTTSSLGNFGAQHGTPMSAVSMASSHATTVQTPASSMLPYNPQQWVASPAQMSAQSQHFPPDSSGSAAAGSAPPPPPYSPPRSQQARPVSTAFEHVLQPLSTPSPRLSAASLVQRPSPEPTNSFPPPPGVGGRGASRERRFGLPSLTRRRDSDQPTASPDMHPLAPYSGRSLGPAVVATADVENIVAPSAVYGQFVPPSSRRAASTGAIDTPTSNRSRSTSQTRWEPGMPLPPPPPGPPPSSSRSQSVQSMDRGTIPIISPPTRRRPPTGVTNLGPVPPTPADWVDSDTQPTRSERPRSPGLTIDTDAAATATQVPEPLTSAGSTGSLSRAGAVRHDKTILQRRSEGRTHASQNSIDTIARPNSISDIVVPGPSNGLQRRLTLNKGTPRSAGKQPADGPRTGDSSLYESRNSTPRGPSSAQAQQFDVSSPQPSPLASRTKDGNDSQNLPHKVLSTPPPQARPASSSAHRDSSRPPPAALKHAATQSADQFASSTVERFRAFALQESAAQSDADRVRMFADFIVSESRIRRERYSTAIGAMGSEIFDLTRDLFRPMTNSRRESATSQEPWTPGSTIATPSHLGSAGPNTQGNSLPNSAPSSAKLPASPGGPPANWGSGGNYMPALSPILSMSVSDNHDNGSSRGRPPSRWWETDSSGDPGQVMERSKRESKYMGLPKEQWIYESHDPYGEGTSSAYPPEKVGWHEQEEPLSTPQPQRLSHESETGPIMTPNVTQYLDVSRLVTMPPPYPRHHPAVNNNHPQLMHIRTAVRGLSELDEITTAKETFTIGSAKRREEFAASAAERKRALRSNLQSEIGSGNIGYSDAAAIESDFQQQEKDKVKELEKTEYDQFQNEVVIPLNDILTKRIARATDLFDDTARQLFYDGENDADMPQEEGDDRPELLEKLTLLKWIFEMRETLHRSIYDLLSDRNYRYREVVLTPYRLSGNNEKLESAKEFFAADEATREHGFANEVLDRAREFRSVLDEAVQRGVAIQLSAFWDIAPPLSELLDSVPVHLDGFHVQIPPSEFDENPSYLKHPLQYLFSLLLHGEKSTYQFIESHTNLLCLLHEVKEAVVVAKSRVLEAPLPQQEGVSEPMSERAAKALKLRETESRRLTEDLQDKVRIVEDQWVSALGSSVQSVKRRTKEYLLDTGGWDETLEEVEMA
ncbi:hypothetical protein VHEMI07424 [[Torrubiella] hemipterigena]|uniref:Uncharacterized protein n=1 Tax=[Torrubiella] hemipterigena TaxID=1531966 RepID=A0A0A1TMY3_9HYPO|nr:hypothetical protein VHEMI07424 [[Torrubiella] hemipterigena]